jgi:DNA primase
MSVVVVEGVTDVCRLGPGAVCTFGIKYKKEQVNLLSTFKNVFVMFDSNEQEAQNKAEDLAHDLNSCVDHVELITLEEAADPGDLDQKTADKIMKELIGGRL